jgi:hypothetical protein
MHRSPSSRKLQPVLPYVAYCSKHSASAADVKQHVFVVCRKVVCLKG